MSVDEDGNVVVSISNGDGVSIAFTVDQREAEKWQRFVAGVVAAARS